MAKENCPRCGDKKHQLNRCPSCGFQRNKQFQVSKISAETEPRSEIPEIELKSNKEVQNVIKRKRSVETAKKKTFSSDSIMRQSSKKPKNKKRSKKFRKKKVLGAGSIMYGLIHKTSAREWHHVK